MHPCARRARFWYMQRVHTGGVDHQPPGDGGDLVLIHADGAAEGFRLSGEIHGGQQGGGVEAIMDRQHGSGLGFCISDGGAYRAAGHFQPGVHANRQRQRRW